MLLHILYLVGITAEAMTGALAAGRRRMDTFGVIIIATATAMAEGQCAIFCWATIRSAGSNTRNM